MDILARVQEKYDSMILLRRYLHENPETGPEEQINTMNMIETQLRETGIPYVRVPGGGVFGFIEGPAEGKTLLMRSDMDALPIQESAYNLKQKRTCCSKVPGVMHGCGHDAHVAMLLTEASILKEMQNELKGSVILMFEEGEEGHMNVEEMCRYIDQEHLQIDGCHASHVRWDIPVGKVACCKKNAMSGHYHFLLKINGMGGHGSRPDLAHSAVECFHEVYSGLEALRLRCIRPDTSLTWSVGSLHAGSRFNLIPDELVCEGSIRMMEDRSGNRFWEEFRRTLDAVCPLHYCTYELRGLEHLLPVVNHSASRELYLTAAKRAAGEDAVCTCSPWMASETFSYLCNMYPGVESFVGIRNEEAGCGANHHTPEFDLDERGLLYGAAAAVGYAKEWLENPPDTSDFTPVCKSLVELISMLHAN